MNVSRFASMIMVCLLPAVPLFACSDEPAEENGGGGASGDVTFHGEVRPFDGVDLDTGMQPPLSPVQISLAFKVDGALTVDAAAVAGGSTSAPTVAGKAGTGKQNIHATLKADAKMKIDFASFHYDGPLPGIEALAVDINGGSDFDPFLLEGSSLTKADVPETKLPPIPLPGGIPGSITLTIEKGSFVRSDFHGVCASVSEGASPTARYVGVAKLDGELHVQATVEIKAGLSKSFDIPSFTLPIPARDVSVDLGSVAVKGGGAAPTGASVMTTGESCDGSSTPTSGDPESENAGSSSSGGSSSGGSSSGGSSTSSSSSGGSSGSTSSSSSGGSSSGSTSSSGGSSSGDGGTVSCATTNVCLSPQDLGTIAGDGSGLATPLTASGTTGKWLRFRVKETENGVGGDNLKVKTTLSGPSGWKFSARMDTGNDVALPCTKTVYSSSNGALTLEWGEGFTANGSDDSRYVVVEVVQGSGACPPSTPWTIRVERVP